MGVDITRPDADRNARSAGLGRSFQDARLWQALTVKEAIARRVRAAHRRPRPLPAIFDTAVAKDSEARHDARGRRADRTAARSERSATSSSPSCRPGRDASSRSRRSSRTVRASSSWTSRRPASRRRETEALGPLLRQVRDHLSCSMLVIEHDMPLITKLADRMYALEQGRDHQRRHAGRRHQPPGRRRVLPGDRGLLGHHGRGDAQAAPLEAADPQDGTHTLRTSTRSPAPSAANARGRLRVFAVGIALLFGSWPRPAGG